MPIEMPMPLPVNTKVFQLMRPQLLSVTGGGDMHAMDRAVPTWMASYETPGLDSTRYNAMLAFLESLQGSKNSFFGFDPRRPMPLAHSRSPVGSNPWGAAITLIEWDPGSATVVLTGGTPGRIISVGDYISFQEGARVWLHRVIAQGTFNVNGTAFPRVTPTPRVPYNHQAAIRYQRAAAEMKMIGGFEERDSVDGLPSFSFKAFQMLRRPA